MATEPALALTVLPGPQTQKEIENTLDAVPKLLLEIEELKRKHADALTELRQSLAKDLATAPLNTNTAAQKHKAWETKEQALVAKDKTAHDLLDSIGHLVTRLIQTQPEATEPVLLRKIEQLKHEAASEQAKVDRLRNQIGTWEALLETISESVAAQTAKTAYYKAAEPTKAKAEGIDEATTRAFKTATKPFSFEKQAETGEWDKARALRTIKEALIRAKAELPRIMDAELANNITGAEALVAELKKATAQIGELRVAAAIGVATTFKEAIQYAKTATLADAMNALEEAADNALAKVMTKKMEPAAEELDKAVNAKLADAKSKAIEKLWESVSVATLDILPELASASATVRLNKAMDTELAKAIKELGEKKAALEADLQKDKAQTDEDKAAVLGCIAETVANAKLQMDSAKTVALGCTIEDFNNAAREVRRDATTTEMKTAEAELHRAMDKAIERKMDFFESEVATAKAQLDQFGRTANEKKGNNATTKKKDKTASQP